ncbi:MAG TPA: hypothetical protein PLM29_00985 [Deltaproteobacteria bacterium]|nr:hypothetical protein [Deltaproteobacteria bacterium]
MLNELHHFSKVLDTIKGIKTYDWHKDFKPLPKASLKKPCYKILFGPEGSISEIEPMQIERVASLRKWEQSNGHSFPGFNIQPLYRVTDEDKKALLKKWREGKAAIDLVLIKEWIANEPQKNWDAKFTKKMAKCLGEIPKELNEKCSDPSSKFSAVNTICERIIKLGESGPEKFFQEILAYILASLEKGASASTLLPFLFHEGSPSKKPEGDRGSVSIFMDVLDWIDYPVAHEDTIQYINECLLTSTTTKEKMSKGLIDAFGDDSNGYEDKLPEVKLPVLGVVKLRAMSKESPCQDRYGTIDAKSFYVGDTSRKRTKRSLEWLADAIREGETWGRADGKELIFAYPTYLPQVPLKLTACFGARKADDSQARFENYANDVISCLSGIPKPLKEIELRVFSLRKMDKARTKVVFYRNYSAQRLADAAREWQTGCSNIPAIPMKAWGNQKGQIISAELATPFPLQIAECLNQVWKLDGTSSGEVQSIQGSSGIELLLDESSTCRLVPHMLGVAIQNGKGLFCSLGNSQHRSEVLKLDGYNKHKQLMPSILGLLLWKLGIGKEQYMQNPPYLVGRILKLADELHSLYCKEVRGGSLPPQLLGNALMAAALDSPTQSLAQLALRIAPYLGWARTNSTNSAGLSRYFLKELSQAEILLRDKPLPTRFDDAARAQLLLGYISGNSQTGEETTI